MVGAGAHSLLTAAGDAWADRAGGTSGALWGIILRSIADVLGDTERPTPTTLAHGVRQASDSVRRTGGAEVGDKTMVDVLVPFTEAIGQQVGEGAELTAAWAAAADVAEQAARDTARLVPRMGRARPHAEKSLGTPDAGAHSLALIVRAVHGALATCQ
ncbi:DAK2 domain-containing protein [Streptomyces sp. NPDC056982]|uniref:DAK2 domain-containing protein n=1 Tax=Streptomyces sp. NPDC056982 TaxID=3345986 RepID=UPI00363D8FDB